MVENCDLLEDRRTLTAFQRQANHSNFRIINSQWRALFCIDHDTSNTEIQLRIRRRIYFKENLKVSLLNVSLCTCIGYRKCVFEYAKHNIKIVFIFCLDFTFRHENFCFSIALLLIVSLQPQQTEAVVPFFRIFVTPCYKLVERSWYATDAIRDTFLPP